MKVAIVTTAVLGLSMSAAMACDYTKNTQAAAPMSKIEKSAFVEPKQTESRQAFLVPQGDQAQAGSATVVTTE